MNLGIISQTCIRSYTLYEPWAISSVLYPDLPYYYWQDMIVSAHFYYNYTYTYYNCYYLQQHYIGE